MRYDYFLIWGNGIEYKWDIINMISTKADIEIIRVENHYPNSISKFVKNIYSYDYAPFRHLKAKTQYLMKSKPEVVIIITKNKNPQEKLIGEGAFRHVECQYIKSIKEEIRDKFNPRFNGKRTEEHIVHASDNQSQVDYLMKYLGYKDGIEFFEQSPNLIIDLPPYIKKFNKFLVKNVSLDKVFCNIAIGHSRNYTLKPLPIEESPHYLGLKYDIEIYRSYVKKFLGGPLKDFHSVEKFISLSKNFKYLKFPYLGNYILVLPENKYEFLIQDGVHRASILKLHGITDIPIIVRS